MEKPANHTICRLLILAECQIVGVTGFEPATPSSRTTYATGLRYTPNNYFKNGGFSKKKLPQFSATKITF
jgi:hypothetical protein